MTKVSISFKEFDNFLKLLSCFSVLLFVLGVNKHFFWLSIWIDKTIDVKYFSLGLSATLVIGSSDGEGEKFGVSSKYFCFYSFRCLW